MGRHSSPERTHFIRSLGAWALPWLLIAAVLVVALVVAFDMVGNDPVRSEADGDAVAVTEDEGSEEPPADDEPEPEDEKTKSSDEEEPASEDETEEAGEGEPDDKPKAEKKKKSDLITKGIEVQVLNGTADSETDDLMADKLTRLGYTVVAVSPASKGYPHTVVFWTEDAEPVATALAEHFGWQSEPAPSNLSTEVHLHIVVGEDAL